MRCCQHRSGWCGTSCSETNFREAGVPIRITVRRIPGDSSWRGLSDLRCLDGSRLLRPAHHRFERRKSNHDPAAFARRRYRFAAIAAISAVLPVFAAGRDSKFRRGFSQLPSARRTASWSAKSGASRQRSSASSPDVIGVEAGADAFSAGRPARTPRRSFMKFTNRSTCSSVKIRSTRSGRFRPARIHAASSSSKPDRCRGNP